MKDIVTKIVRFMLRCSTPMFQAGAIIVLVLTIHATAHVASVNRIHLDRTDVSLVDYSSEGKVLLGREYHEPNLNGFPQDRAVWWDEQGRKYYIPLPEGGGSNVLCGTGLYRGCEEE